MIVQDGITINVPIERVWSVFTDVERWPEWTASVTTLEVIAGTGITRGARVRIKQPRFPQLVWEVTEVEPGTSWTWVTTARGAVTSATHRLTRVDDATTRVEQVIEQTGVLGALVGRLTARLTRRYLAMEAAGLKQRAEAGIATA